MKNFIVISGEGLYFSLFYNLAFSVALLIILIEGYKRNYPMLKWIVLILFSRIFFIIGTKVITWTAAEWVYFFNSFNLPETETKSMAGGLFFGILALISGKYLLKFRENIFDPFAIALPVAMAIQRMGCFFSGCCYGNSSIMPWAVKYPANTLPHYHQFQSGFLTYADQFSLPIHPVQIYEAIGLLTISFIILRFRNKFRVGGNLMVFSFFLIFLVRFITEFFRASLAHTIGGEVVGFMNMTQWVLLPLIILMALILYRREGGAYRLLLAKKTATNELSITVALVSITLITVILYLLGNWFTYTEMLAMAFSVMVAIVFLSGKLLQNFYHSPKRWMYLAGIVLPVILMSQTVPDNEQDNLFNKSYKTIMVGFGTGQFENNHTYGTGSGCDRITNTSYFEQKYTLAGAGFSNTNTFEELKMRQTWGVNAFFGKHTESGLTSLAIDSRSLIGVTPFINIDQRWIGVGAGLYMGSLSYATEDLTEERSGIPVSAKKTTFVYPELYFRLGPEDYFFFDYRLAEHFPSALPGLRHQFGLGTGLGKRDGTYLRFGHTGLNFYLAGNLPVKNTVVFQPFFAWGSEAEYYRKKQFQFSVGLGYRFDQKYEVKPNW
jgi:prolipoprotein diacylglyceryltransferase